MRYWLAILLLCSAASMAMADEAANDSAAAPTDAANTADSGEHPRAAYAEHAHKQIERIMSGSRFGVRETHMEFRLRYEPKPSLEQTPGDYSWLLALERALGLLAHSLVWILIAAVLIMAFMSRRRWLPLLRPSAYPAAARKTLSPLLQATNLAAEQPLPVDIATAAEACWEQGDARGAMSLLYRGALASLRRTTPDLRDSATEHENLSLVRRVASTDLTSDFTRIVRAWQGIAYARQTPATFPDLLVAFRRHFSGSSGL